MYKPHTTVCGLYERTIRAMSLLISSNKIAQRMLQQRTSYSGETERIMPDVAHKRPRIRIAGCWLCGSNRAPKSNLCAAVGRCAASTDASRRRRLFSRRVGEGRHGQAGRCRSPHSISACPRHARLAPESDPTANVPQYPKRVARPAIPSQHQTVRRARGET